MKLGFGLISYRNLLEQLIICFFLLSCMVFPVFLIYTGGSGYGLQSGIISNSTLGNLGQSSTECSQVPLSFDKIGLTCPYGKIKKWRNVGIN